MKLKTPSDCHSIFDLRMLARLRLPPPIFDTMDGAAETEFTARRNTAAFDAETLVPRCLVDVGAVNTSTRILGQDVLWPVFCSPTGASRLFHPDGEPARMDIFTEQLDPSITWRDIREIADSWGGPLALKGVMSAEDARRAVDFGVTAVMVSNHGGRQLDGAAAPIEVLPDIVRAVGGRLEVILDSGIRRGVHVLKALARGATGCSIGRPYLYGLSAGGEAGVAKALEILRSELVLAMQLSGCADLKSIDEDLIRPCA